MNAQTPSARLVSALSTGHALLLLVQPLLAGLILSGSEFDAVDAHKWLGKAIFLACGALLLAMVRAWRKGEVSGVWPMVTFLLLCAEAAQIHLGFKADLMLHVPLGTIIVAAGAVIAFSALRDTWCSRSAGVRM